jgi:hypothetical protein
VTRHLLALAASVALANCAGVQPEVKEVEFRPEEPLASVALPVRITPAIVSSESERDLTEEGYVALGTLTVTRLASKPTFNPTERACLEAARRGGILVRLEFRDRRETFEATRVGPCVRTEGRMFGRPVRGQMEYEMVYQCVEWERTSYSIPIVRTRARVYSNDPSLVVMARGRRLLLALQAGDTELASRLIEEGADLNVTDERGETPLALAVKRGDLRLVERLIRAGANVNAPVGWEGKTVLQLVADHAEIRAVLMRAGARSGAATRPAAEVSDDHRRLGRGLEEAAPAGGTSTAGATTTPADILDSLDANRSKPAPSNKKEIPKALDAQTTR